jgi:hypothetical protein
MKRLREVRRVIKSNINKTFMKEGSYEEVKYGDETFKIDKSTGKIETNYTMKNSQGRTIKQEEDSAKIIGIAIIALIVLGIVLVFV